MLVDSFRAARLADDQDCHRIGSDVELDTVGFYENDTGKVVSGTVGNTIEWFEYMGRMDCRYRTMGPMILLGRTVSEPGAIGV
jgi:hypothetical protein